MEKERTEGDVHTRCQVLLQSFSEQDGNVARVYKDCDSDDSVASVITLQTKTMRQYYTAFLETLFVDATHGTIERNECIFM